MSFLDNNIKYELIKVSYNNIDKVQIPAFPFLAFVFYTLYGNVALYQLIVWLGVSLILHIFPFFLKRWYMKTSQQGRADPKWQRYLTINVFLLGGASSIVSIFAVNVDENSYKVIVFMLMLTVVIFSSFGNRRIFIPFASPICIMLSISYLMVFGEDDHFFIIFYLALFILIIINFSVEKSLANSIKIRFENESLINKLEIEKERSEQSVREKSLFMAAANHDVRQPLQAVHLYLDILKETKLTEEQSILIKKINYALNESGKLFQGVLDISKIDSGMTEKNIEDFYIDDILLNLLERYRDIAKYKNLIFDENMEHVAINSDPVLLERIVDNLLSNAIRYTNTGSIGIRVKRDANHVILEITDTGIGISEQEIKNVFMPFYQIGNAQRDRQKGLGLGLSIVNKLCDLLGVSLKVDSVLDQGTVFRLNLPMGNPTAIVKKPNHEPLLPDVSAIKILCIDNEKIIRDALEQLFGLWGWDAKICGSKDEAIHVVKEGYYPNMILSDFRLQNSITGVDVIESIRGLLNDEVPAILITGDTSVERLSTVVKSGYPVLHKPINAGKLKNMVSHTLKQL